jgi:protein-disulfide isomerase
MMITRGTRFAAAAGASLLLAGLSLAGLLLAACDQLAPPAPDKPAELYKVPLGDSPARGGKAPRVTIVVFSEFECPYCARVAPTLEQVAKAYGDDVRLVWKHRPLPFHQRALPAALAAEAAGEQGKFWQMHDRLFASQQALDAATVEGHARALGLDVARWQAALASPRLRGRIEADGKLAEQLAVNGTPTFFVNGRPLVGAQPLERWRALIDEELARADQRLAAGAARAGLYAELTRAGLDRREAGPGPARRLAAAGGGANCPSGACPGKQAHAPAAAALEDDRDRVYKVDPGASEARGPRDAAVTVVLFSEFQCPYCKQIGPTLEALEREFPGKLRVVWKHFPLEFHAQARPAALAAQAAAQQGKFWEMHARLFEDQAALGAGDLERHARALGLDVARWKAAMASPEVARAVDADRQQGQALGVTGTPSLFINGRKVVGALPAAQLRPVVAQALAN